MSTKVVGLDLGTHSVKVCELVTTFRQHELVGFAAEPVEAEPGSRPTLPAIAAAARRLLERRGLLAEQILCSLPADHVSTVTLDFPFDQPKKIEATLPFQLEEVLPVDIDDLVHDYQIVRRRPDGGVTVLVAYTRRAVFEAFLATLAEVGIDPKVVGLGALTYYNLYDHLLADATAPVAVLDIGHVHSELVVFDGGEAAVVRPIPGGGLDVTRALARAFQVAPDQAERGKLAEGFIAPPGHDTFTDYSVETGQSRRELISRAAHTGLAQTLREVKRSLLLHNDATGSAVERLYLTGGGATLRGMADYLSAQLGVEVAYLDPLAVSFNRLPEGQDRLKPYAGKALASAMRVFNRRHQGLINFRKGEFAYTGDFGFLRGRIISLAVAAALAIVLGAGVAVSRKNVLEAEHETLLAQVRAVSGSILGRETDDVDQVFRVMIAAESNEAKLLPQVSALQMLGEVSAKVGTDLTVDLDQFDIDLDRKKIEIRGRTGSGGDVERLVDALEGHRCFKNVAKDRVEKTMDEKTKFRLTANSGCS